MDRRQRLAILSEAAGLDRDTRLSASARVGNQVGIAGVRLPGGGSTTLMRIMQTNELRGLLYEFGLVLSDGHRALLKELPVVLLEAQSRLPAMLLESLQEQVRRISDLDAAVSGARPSPNTAGSRTSTG